MLLDKRKDSISLLQEILRSLFLDKFWLKNPESPKWPEVEIINILKDKGGSRSGPFGSNLKKEEIKDVGEVAVLGIDNAVNNTFQWNEKRFVSKEKYETLKNYTVYPRDVIITLMGTVGKSAVIPDDISLAINTKHLAALTLNEDLCNPYFLKYAIQMNPFIKFQIKTKSRGAVMEGINLDIIRKLKFHLPPIQLQREFETQYRYIFEKKSQLEQSLGILDTLFKSFIQIAFKDSGFKTISETDQYLSDNLLQQELIDKIKIQDFQAFEEYQKAKKILFTLLETQKSNITQTIDSKKKKIKIQFS